MNLDAVEAQGLQPGDVVLQVTHAEVDGETYTLEEESVISSIRANGRLAFKGGNGRGAWARDVRKVPASQPASDPCPSSALSVRPVRVVCSGDRA